MITKTARSIRNALSAARSIPSEISDVFGGVGPEEMIKSHNLLSRLRSKAKALGKPDGLIGSFTANIPDRDIAEAVFNPLGGYGKGPRVNRSMRKHILPRLDALLRQRTAELSGEIY